MNAFEKHKNYLKEMRKRIEFEIDVLNKALDVLELLLCTDENSDSFKEVLESTKKLYVAEDTDLTRLFKNMNSKDDISRVAKMIRSIKNNYESENKIVTYIINSLGSDQVINIHNDITMLVITLAAAIEKGELTQEDGRIIIASAIAFDKAHIKKLSCNEKEIACIDVLGNYFAIDGSFKYYNPIPFASVWEEFMSNAMAVGYALDEKVNYTSANLVDHVFFSYMEFHKARRLEKQKYDKEQKEAKKAFVKKDYVPTPKEKPQPEEEKSFFTDAEKATIYIARDLFYNKLRPFDPYYYELKRLLDEIPTLEEMAKDSDNDDLASLIAIRIEVIDSINEILGQVETPDEETNNSLIYLTDKNNVPYIKTDLNDIDNSLRAQALSLLSKIRDENKGNFKLVCSNRFKKTEVFEICNRKIHVIFKILEPGLYLVIGISTIGNDYDKIINRLYSRENREYIEGLHGLLSNEAERAKLLIEHGNIGADLNGSRLKRESDNN